MLTRLFVLGVLLGGSHAVAAPAVLLAPVLGLPERVMLQGRVLKEAPSDGSSALSRNLRRLAAPNWEGAKVSVRFQGVTAIVTSGHDGGFEVTLMPPEGGRFKEGASEAEAWVEGAITSARVEVLPASTSLLVVSDFDDTLAVTQVTKPAKLVQTALLKDSDTQEVVPGMAALYGCLRGSATSSAFALVSGSPVQYLPRVRGFLERHQFPAGFGVYLRDLGPSSLSNYKQPIIRRLLTQFPLPVVLVGDSGEKDPEVYAQIREEFPGRVKAVYIRDAGRTKDVKRFQDMVLFKDAREAAEHAVGLGLADAACVASVLPKPSVSLPATAGPTPP
ncbi:App1 family protein [Myxococcus sp. CA056]|uniref:phosphatase domain-containing protein n=1 Tax=unclassified Myxococcus TaxID=2648731 RepID=UPI00157B1D8C|nr:MULTISPECIES: App1 family protein [unclassified Myxococcus]NTX12536.1 App1 family protein [Myxococcus sp. CA056]NTX33555.1 App1 family protein [Myxococcus sp. CA033]